MSFFQCVSVSGLFLNAMIFRACAQVAFLDYVAYIPLFLDMHETIVDNPFVNPLEYIMHSQRKPNTTKSDTANCPTPVEKETCKLDEQPCEAERMMETRDDPDKETTHMGEHGDTADQALSKNNENCQRSALDLTQSSPSDRVATGSRYEDGEVGVERFEGEIGERRDTINVSTSKGHRSLAMPRNDTSCSAELHSEVASCSRPTSSVHHQESVNLDLKSSSDVSAEEENKDQTAAHSPGVASEKDKNTFEEESVSKSDIEHASAEENSVTPTSFVSVDHDEKLPAEDKTAQSTEKPAAHDGVMVSGEENGHSSGFSGDQLSSKQAALASPTIEQEVAKRSPSPAERRARLSSGSESSLGHSSPDVRKASPQSSAGSLRNFNKPRKRRLLKKRSQRQQSRRTFEGSSSDENY